MGGSEHSRLPALLRYSVSQSSSSSSSSFVLGWESQGWPKHRESNQVAGSFAGPPGNGRRWEEASIPLVAFALLLGLPIVLVVLVVLGWGIEAVCRREAR
jgi:hypothetical protein